MWSSFGHNHPFFVVAGELQAESSVGLEFPTRSYITVEVGSSIGLHARSANIIAETVQAADVPVTLSVLGGEPVDSADAPTPDSRGSASDRNISR